MEHNISLITTLAGGFGLALIFGFIAEKIKLPALIGYLCAGILLGPATPGFVADIQLAAQLSEIGVMLLMFGVGLHFSVKDLMAVRRIAVPGALVQIGVATLLGIGLAAVILLLVRRDHLYLLHGLFWILVAGAAAVLGVWPGLIDRLAVVVGISYPPALLLLVAVVIVLVKTLHTDIVNTRVERDVRRLNQRLAILEADNAALRELRQR